MQGSEFGKDGQEHPLKYALAGSDRNLHVLLGTSVGQFPHRVEMRFNDLEEISSLRGELKPPAPTEKKFRPEELLQLFQLAAELTLPGRIPWRRIADSGGGDDLCERSQSFEGEAGFCK